MTDIMTADRKLAANAKTKTRHRHRHTHRRQPSSLIHHKWIGILAVVTTLLIFVTTGLIILALLNNREINQLTLANRQQAHELQQLRPQVEQQAIQIAALVEKRLPSLQQIQLDQVIPLKHDYLKNIVFTRTGKFHINRYEFKITADNKGLAPVRPEFKVIFFSHLGIQLSAASIGIDEDNLPTFEALQSGESRSFSNAIQLASGDEQPQYFKISSNPTKTITFLE